MKSNTLKLLFATSIVAMMVLACSKEEEEKKPITKADLLTAKPWRILTKTFTPALLINGKKTNNYFDLYDKNAECIYDLQYKFEANGDLLFEQGSNLCIDDLPASIKGTWSLNTKQDVLFFKIPKLVTNAISDFDISNNGTFVDEYEMEYQNSDTTYILLTVRDTYTNK